MWALVATIGGFIPGLFGKQISFKFAKVAGIAVIVVGLIALLSLGRCAYDQSVIEDHETEQRAESAETALESERQADLDTAEEIADLKDETAALEQAVKDAERAQPEKAKAAVGPASQSYYDNLPEGKRTRQ